MCSISKHVAVTCSAISYSLMQIFPDSLPYSHSCCNQKMPSSHVCCVWMCLTSKLYIICIILKNLFIFTFCNSLMILTNGDILFIQSTLNKSSIDRWSFALRLLNWLVSGPPLESATGEWVNALMQYCIHTWVCTLLHNRPSSTNRLFVIATFLHRKIDRTLPGLLPPKLVQFR